MLLHVVKKRESGLDSRTESFLYKLIFALLAFPLTFPVLYFVSLFLLRFTTVQFFFTIFPKALIFQALVEIALLLYIFLVIRERRYAPFITLTHALLFLVAFVLGVTSFFSLDPNFSFFGDTQRADGLLFLFHVGLYIFLLSWLVRTRARLETLFHIALGAGAVTMSFIGLIVLSAGLSSVFRYSVWEQTAAFVLENKNFFAHYVLILLFFTTYFLLKKPKLWNILLFFVLLFFLSLSMSSTAIVIGIVLAFILAFMVSLKLFVGLFVLGSGFLLYGFLNESAYLTTLVQSNSLFARWYIWKDAIVTVMSTNPFSGFGWGNNLLMWNAAPQHLLSAARFSNSVVFDKIHNIVLEFLSAAGLTGVFVLLAFWGQILWRALVRALGTHKRIWMFFFLVFSANSLFLLFNFDSLMSYILVSLLLVGFILFLKDSSLSLQVSGKIVPLLALPVLLVGVFTLYEFSIKPFYSYALMRQAHYELFRASVSLNLQQKESLSLLQKAENISQPYDAILADIALVYEQVPSVLLLTSEEKEGVYKNLKNIYEGLIAQHPFNAQNHYKFAITEKRFLHYEAAKLQLQEAVRLSPQTFLFRIKLVQVYIQLGEFPPALQELQEMSLQRAYLKRVDFYYALLQIATANLSEGGEMLVTSIPEYLPDFSEWRLVEKIYRDKSESKELLSLYSRFLGVVDDKMPFYMMIIHLAQELGEEAMAQKYLLEAQENMTEEERRAFNSELLGFPFL